MSPSSHSPDLPAVQRAFQMAASLPTGAERTIRVGVLAADGVLLASETLAGEEQAAFLSDQLKPLHFSEYRSARTARMFGCDLLLKHSPVGAGMPDDLVRSDGTKWPPRTGWVQEVVPGT